MLSEKKSEKKRKKKTISEFRYFVWPAHKVSWKLELSFKSYRVPNGQTNYLYTRESDPYWLGKWLKPTNSEKLHLHYLN